MVLVVCILLSCLSYFGNANHQLLHWDDITYISRNPWITEPSFANLIALLTQSHLNNWHPLTWLSYIPEYYLCGENAVCYKNTNIVLHGVNAFLVYILGLTIFGRIFLNSEVQIKQVFLASFLAALTFAVHTQHVESVIWAVERKDLLCALFFFLSMIYYLRQRVVANYSFSLPVFIFFLLALLSKPMAVTLPGVLLILDFYPLKRFDNANLSRGFDILVREKWIYYVCSIAVALITVLSQQVEFIEQPSFLVRIEITVIAIWHYLFSLFYLVDFSPFYPATEIFRLSQQYWWLYIFGAVALVLLVFSKGKPAMALACYFLVTLLPVIGVIKVGSHAYADRYTYIPMIGFYLLLSWWLSVAYFKTIVLRKVLVVSLVVLATAMAYHTYHYKNVWQSDLTLWTYVAQVFPESSDTVYNNLGNSYFMRGEYQQALEKYQKARDLNDERLLTYSNIAFAYLRLGNKEQGMMTYEQAVKKFPDNTMAYLIAGDANLIEKNMTRAHQHYSNALMAYTDSEVARNFFPEGLLALGRIFFNMKDVESAEVAAQLLLENGLLEIEAILMLAKGYSTINSTNSLKLLSKLEQLYGPDQRIEAIRESINN